MRLRLTGTLYLPNVTKSAATLNKLLHKLVLVPELLYPFSSSTIPYIYSIYAYTYTKDRQMYRFLK